MIWLVLSPWFVYSQASHLWLHSADGSYSHANSYINYRLDQQHHSCPGVVLIWGIWSTIVVSKVIWKPKHWSHHNSAGIMFHSSLGSSETLPTFRDLQKYKSEIKSDVPSEATADKSSQEKVWFGRVVRKKEQEAASHNPKHTNSLVILN